MLFLNIEKYGASFHVYGDCRGGVNTEFRSSSTLSDQYGADLERFDNLAPVRGERFEFAEIGGYKVYSYIRINQKIICDRRAKGGYDMAQLVIFYKKRKIEIPFEEWLKMVPGIADNPSDYRSNLAIFRTYEGLYVLFYIQNGKLGHQVLEEPCFIKEGNVVTLKQVIQNRRDQMTQLQKQVEQKIERLTTQSFRLSEELHASEFLNQCVWNPR